jgi:hypothetical protein
MSITRAFEEAISGREVRASKGWWGCIHGGKYYIIKDTDPMLEFTQKSINDYEEGSPRDRKLISEAIVLVKTWQNRTNQ